MQRVWNRSAPVSVLKLVKKEIKEIQDSAEKNDSSQPC